MTLVQFTGVDGKSVYVASNYVESVTVGTSDTTAVISLRSGAQEVQGTVDEVAQTMRTQPA